MREIFINIEDIEYYLKHEIEITSEENNMIKLKFIMYIDSVCNDIRSKEKEIIDEFRYLMYLNSYKYKDYSINLDSLFETEYKKDENNVKIKAYKITFRLTFIDTFEKDINEIKGFFKDLFDAKHYRENFKNEMPKTDEKDITTGVFCFYGGALNLVEPEDKLMFLIDEKIEYAKELIKPYLKEAFEAENKEFVSLESFTYDLIYDPCALWDKEHIFETPVFKFSVIVKDKKEA